MLSKGFIQVTLNSFLIYVGPTVLVGFISWIFSPVNLGLFSTLILIASGFFYVLSVFNLKLAYLGRFFLVATVFFLGAQIFRFSFELGDLSYFFNWIVWHLSFAGAIFALGLFGLLFVYLQSRFFHKGQWDRCKWNSVHLFAGSLLVLLGTVGVNMGITSINFGFVIFSSIFFVWGFLTLLSPFLVWLRPISAANIFDFRKADK